MNYEAYLAQRTVLVNETQKLIEDNKIEESNAKMKEIEDLDNKWEGIKLANANLNALKDNKTAIELENKSLTVEGGKTVDNILENKAVDSKVIYLNAWSKEMMGAKLTQEEQEVFNKVNTDFQNAYTHTTINTSTLIPETVAAGIWKRAEEMYPMLADIKKFNVRGTLTINKHASIDAGDAAWYAEDTATADEQNTFAQISLTGCELSKAITVSWKLKAMAIEEFIPYIINELGERMGVVLGTAMYTGTGVAGVQPQGIITALAAEALTPQIVVYTAIDPLSYEKMTEAVSKIHSSYLSGCSIYATSATIWTEIANLMDGVGRPLFIPDVSNGGVGRMFGMTVKADAGAGVANIVIGNAANGYVFNTNEPMSVVTEDHAKARTTDYVGYTVVDGEVLDNKAFVLLDKQ